MTTPAGARERPLSPFMIGPYYRPQLTSMLSITHRGTGVLLALGAFVFAWWLFAIAAGPDAYLLFESYFGGLLGLVIALGFAFSLSFHLLNGVRHLLWDIGWGLDLDRTYATGWSVLVLALIATAALGWQAFGGRG
jgi:succinate dehydrogenase / fumarate reductase cytochrome b subunit